MLRMRFEKHPNNHVYGTFEVYNQDEDVILGSTEYFTLDTNSDYLKPHEWGCEFYLKLETIYRLFDLDLEKDIKGIIKKLKNTEIVEETKKLI